MHISEVNPKTAAVLERVKLENDWYHRNIMTAARRLYNDGKGEAIYLTQYSSGNSTWHYKGTHITVEVNQ